MNMMRNIRNHFAFHALLHILLRHFITDLYEMLQEGECLSQINSKENTVIFFLYLSNYIE